MLTVTRFTVTSDKLPCSLEGCRILQLTDLHGKSFGAGNELLLEKIEEAAPSLVVSTGDMINSTDDNGEVFLGLANAIAKKYPFYCVDGNHEQKITRQDAVRYSQINSRLEQAGAVLINNRRVNLAGGANLFGLNMPPRYYWPAFKKRSKGIGELTKDEVGKLIGNPDRAGFNILLAHTPQYFSAYSDWGADLIFCGHIHGGMIRLPCVGGLLSPDVTFFPKYDAGHYLRGGSSMIVGRGLGSNGKIRICNPPELVLVTLRKSLR